ncbi:MAG: bifunctional 2-polyprenyl-6-hydroxyphenol methylase/3-demethylubiquinol 3-O-methyltransferase UbiG [Rickettsiales bacterium]
MSQTKTYNSADPLEVAQFSRLADRWWDERGPFRPLHRMNPLRISYIRDQAAIHFPLTSESVTPLDGLRLADIGCGGGLLCEPMRRLGAKVTGIDASEENIVVAEAHAAQMSLDIAYKSMTAEQLVEQKIAPFDVILALEIIEHVNEPQQFLKTLAALVKPGGLLFLSTLNRTAKSFALAIVGAEYVMRWLPRGTHQWEKFLRPSEIIRPLEEMGFECVDLSGMIYHPLKNQFSLSKTDTDVNYLVTLRKR